LDSPSTQKRVEIVGMSTLDFRVDALAEAVNDLSWAVTALALKGRDEPNTNDGKEAMRHLREVETLLRDAKSE
jgi:hypothetical protein